MSQENSEWSTVSLNSEWHEANLPDAMFHCNKNNCHYPHSPSLKKSLEDVSSGFLGIASSLPVYQPVCACLNKGAIIAAM